MNQKRLCLLTLLLTPALALFSQTSVPTSWNCDAQPPVGWTHNWQISGSTQFYTSSQQVCEGSAAARLDATNESITVNTSSQPGRVVYNIIGTGTSGSWQGTFTIQESVDGASWNTLKTYGNAQLPFSPACNYDSVLVTNTNVRYVRFFFSSKTSGYNVAIDDIRVREPLHTNPKLKIEENASVISNGGYASPVSSPVATPVNMSFTLRNASQANLTLAGISFSGTNASDFSIVSPSFPLSIPAQGTQVLTIQFTPGGASTRNAKFTITSDDAYGDALYTVNLYGVGGNYATAPGSASNLNFPINKTYRTIVSFSNTTVDYYGGYLVLRSEGAPVNTWPSNGTNYQVGETIGNAKVVYNDKGDVSSTSFWPRWVLANTTYHFAVVPYNGGGSPVVSYQTNNVLTGSVNTPASMASPTKYASIDPLSGTLITDLHNLINPHSSVFYSNYRPTIIDGFYTRDTFVVQGANTFNKVFNCSYSSAPILFNQPFDFTATGTSREHTFPHSWMPTFPANAPEKPEYNDQHHLYPTLQSNVNEARCNYPLGEVVTPIIAYQQGVMGLDTAGNRVYEPADAHKGAAARAMFYMAVCYNTVSGNAWNLDAPIGEVCAAGGTYNINYPQNQQVLKNWHFAFPPTRFDMARNDYLDSLQGNRNPFVDNPDWVCYIDFKTMTYISNPTIPCNTGNSSLMQDASENLHVILYPNPATDYYQISLYSDISDMAKIRLIDMAGREVSLYAVAVQPSNNTFTYPVPLSSGMYLIEISSSVGKTTKRLIVQ
ncbi:MAG: endonuclease [Flavobacteriales bacterium]|nr:endonuclease [Flavobacteriales bacterium]